MTSLHRTAHTTIVPVHCKHYGDNNEDITASTPSTTTAGLHHPQQLFHSGGGGGGSTTTTTMTETTSIPEQQQQQEEVLVTTDTSSSSDPETIPVHENSDAGVVVGGGATADSDTMATAAISTTTTTLQPPRNFLLRALWNHKTKRNSHREISKKLKNRNSLNLRRKVLHASWGLFFACLHHTVPRVLFLSGMTILSCSTLLMELLRYQPGFHWMNDALHQVLGSSLRKHEMEEGKFTGSFYFFTGVTLTSMFFEKHAATLGISQLALADPSASYFGRATRHVYWSRIENGLGGIGRNKGILGFLGGAAVCVPYNYRVLKLAQYMGTTNNNVGTAAMILTTTTPLPGGESAIWMASWGLGLAGAFADLCVPTPAVVLPKTLWGRIPLPPLHLDDNFVVPIFSAWACQRLFRLLGWDPSRIQLANALIIQIATSSNSLGLVSKNHRSHHLPPTTETKIPSGGAGGGGGGKESSTLAKPISVSPPVAVVPLQSHSHSKTTTSSSSTTPRTFNSITP
jgi:dolichol kinase